MAMNSVNQVEIIKSTLDGFKARCSQNYIEISEEDMVMLHQVLNDILITHQDNSNMIGGEWDNG